MTIEARLEEFGLVLPAPPRLPPDVRLPFSFVRIHGDRAIVSGHGPQLPDGSLARPSARLARRSLWKGPISPPA